jgi:hypothetical protein
MKSTVLIGLAVLMVFSLVAFAFCGENDLPKEKIIAIAAAAVKEAGIVVEGVDIIYDEDGKLWDEKTGFLAGEDKSPNHGILRRGFLKNYKIVYFDFKEPIKDVWVFIDKDSGEVFEVYKE